MIPERSTPKTKVAPLIIKVPKSDKDIFAEIIKVHKRDKEAKFPSPKPSSVPKK